MQSYSNKRVICLIAIILSAVLWLFAPFMAINLATLDEQPAALQYVLGNVFVIGNLYRSPTFISAVTALISIIICFICILSSKMTLARIIAAIPLFPMLYAIYYFVEWFEEYDIIFHAFGFGYWFILILLLVILFFGGNNKTQSDYAG